MSEIIQLAPDFFRISLLGADFFNVYLLEDVLVDSGPSFTGSKLGSLLKGRPLKAHALTHAHFDHQGASRLMCASFGIPLWCGQGDRQAVETGKLDLLSPPATRSLARFDSWLAGPAQPVARILHEGDEVGGFRVLEVPGHTPGSLAFWRQQDRILVIGDILFHRNPLTLRAGLREPFPSVTFDPAQNRAAARRLAVLQPSLVCFGHGSELQDTSRFVEFVTGLPQD